MLGMRWRAWRRECFQAREGARAGLTGQRQRRLVPPGFLLKTRPPSPSGVSSSSSAAALSSFCQLPPSPSSSCSLSPPVFPRSLPLFISLPSCSSPGPLQTLSSGLRVGGGWLRRWDEEIERDKSPEMRRSAESGCL